MPSPVLQDRIHRFHTFSFDNMELISEPNRFLQTLHAFLAAEVYKSESLQLIDEVYRDFSRLQKEPGKKKKINKSPKCAEGGMTKMSYHVT